MEKQLSYIANRIVIESMMQKENLNTSVDVVHPTHPLNETLRKDRNDAGQKWDAGEPW